MPVYWIACGLMVAAVVGWLARGLVDNSRLKAAERVWKIIEQHNQVGTKLDQLSMAITQLRSTQGLHARATNRRLEGLSTHAVSWSKTTGQILAALINSGLIRPVRRDASWDQGTQVGEKPPELDTLNPRPPRAVATAGGWGTVPDDELDEMPPPRPPRGRHPSPSAT